MKRIGLILFILLILGAGLSAWLFLGSATGFSSAKETLYIPSNAATKKAVMDSLVKNKIINNDLAFDFLAKRLHYWKKIKPGKYEVKKGTSALTLVRMLRNGQQTPVNLVINKIRTKEDFARLVGNKFECDSSEVRGLLDDNEQWRKYGLTPETALTAVLPDTYTFLWTTKPVSIIDRLYKEYQKYWNEDRKKKAAAHGLNPITATIMASIVEEETNASSEKGTIASVYLNRLNKGMPLQADPTVKFALKDFGLKRIYQKHLQIESPYNTYRNAGLPPGPICTPSKKTIDAVLDAPNTQYLYFVASPAFDGKHVFSETYAEHLLKAKQYQQALNRQDSLRKKI